MALQDTFGQDIPRGQAGQVANGETSNRITRTIEDAAGIGFGKAAFRGSADQGITGTPAANTFMGIAIANYGIQPVPGGVAADIYPQRSNVALLNFGVIWVIAGEAVTDGAAAYVTSAGAFVDTATDNIAIPAVFDETVASGQPVRLRVRLP